MFHENGANVHGAAAPGNSDPVRSTGSSVGGGTGPVGGTGTGMVASLSLISNCYMLRHSLVTARQSFSLLENGADVKYSCIRWASKRCPISTPLRILRAHCISTSLVPGGTLSRNMETKLCTAFLGNICNSISARRQKCS